MEGYDRISNYGSRDIALADVPHDIEAHAIKVIVATTFTLLEEEGYSETGAGVAQIEEVTLTGTSGTATITLAGGLTKVATWATNLTDTAAAFVTSHAAAYKAVGIIVTSTAAVIEFTAAIAGTPIIQPAIAPTTGDLDGTVAQDTANKTTPLSEHGIFGEIAVGEIIYAKTKFTKVQVSGGTISTY